VSAPHEDDMASQPPDDAVDPIGEILRERFRQAVAGLEPGPGTLDYLRRAVPARRRRRHAALAATAVSVFAVSAGATLAARSSFESGSSQANGAAIGNLLTTATDDAPGGGSGHGPGTPGGQDMSSGGAVGGEASSAQAPAPGTPKPPLSTTALSATVSGSPAAPLCQNSSVTSVVATQNGMSGGVTYETFQGTAKTVCTLAGMPALTVTGAGGAPAKVAVYRADQSITPLLPAVAAAGQALVLHPGERFEFQLAWVPVACPTSPSPTPPTSVPTSGSPAQTAATSGPTPTGPVTPSSSQPTVPSGTPSLPVPSSSVYSVVYSVSGSQPVQSVSFRADCGAAVYVTDYFPVSGQRPPTPPATSSVTGR
jgi:hypothetical protein